MHVLTIKIFTLLNYQINFYIYAYVLSITLYRKI